MTETITYPAQQPEAAIPLGSADILLNLVVIFLAPIFLSACNGDITLARLAAIETVKSYRAQNHADLLAVAQIVAFGFATLGSLCLSMADDISLTMLLRLRGNANALNRSAEAHRRRLEHRANASQPQPVAYPPAQAAQPATAPRPRHHPIPPRRTPRQPHPRQLIHLPPALRRPRKSPPDSPIFPRKSGKAPPSRPPRSTCAPATCSPR